MPYIASLDQLESLNHHRAVVRYSRDGGRTWEYAKLDGAGRQSYQDDGNGYSAVREVVGNMHGATQFLDIDFQPNPRQGRRFAVLIETTTPGEVRGKHWSYE